MQCQTVFKLILKPTKPSVTYQIVIFIIDNGVVDITCWKLFEMLRRVKENYLASLPVLL